MIGLLPEWKRLREKLMALVRAQSPAKNAQVCLIPSFPLRHRGDNANLENCNHSLPHSPQKLRVYAKRCGGGEGGGVRVHSLPHSPQKLRGGKSKQPTRTKNTRLVRAVQQLHHLFMAARLEIYADRRGHACVLRMCNINFVHNMGRSSKHRGASKMNPEPGSQPELWGSKRRVPTRGEGRSLL